MSKNQKQHKGGPYDVKVSASFPAEKSERLGWCYFDRSGMDVIARADGVSTHVRIPYGKLRRMAKHAGVEL